MMLLMEMSLIELSVVTMTEAKLAFVTSSMYGRPN